MVVVNSSYEQEFLKILHLSSVLKIYVYAMLLNKSQTTNYVEISKLSYFAKRLEKLKLGDVIGIEYYNLSIESFHILASLCILSVTFNHCLAQKV